MSSRIEENGLDKLKKDFEDLVAGIKILWFGTLDEEGNYSGNGLQSVIQPIWDAIVEAWGNMFSVGEDGKGNILLDWFNSMFPAVQDFFTDTVGPWIVSFFHGLWTNLYNGLDAPVKQALQKAGINDPNSSEITNNNDGTYTITSTNNRSITRQMTPEQAAFLSQIKNYIAIDENDNLYATKEAGGLRDTVLGGLFGSAYGINDFLRDFLEGKDVSRSWDAIAGLLAGSENTGSPEEMIRRLFSNAGINIDSGAPVGQVPVSADLEEADTLVQDWKAEVEGEEVTIKVLIDGAGNPLGPKDPLASDSIIAAWLRGDFKPSSEATLVVPIKTKTNNTIQRDIDSGGPYNANVILNPTSPDPHTTKEAWGGRIGQQINNVTVGEDGTEYIIPITKTERAASLIKQMLTEMGGAFTSRIMADLGLGAEGTIGSGLGSIASALSGGSGVSMTYNVSAPVSITVTASGVAAESVGEQAYNLASRYLVRTLQGVFA